MKSRGLAYTLGAGARKSLVLSWTALFLCSLLLQYASVVAPASVLAVHDEGLFELDGNVESSGAPGDDWNAVYNDNDDAFEALFVTDPINGDNDKFFLGGDSKDIADISTWAWTTNGQPQDKNDISNAYAAAYRKDGELLVYFGLDRYASDGDAQAGFWFLKNEFGIAGGPRTGTFNGSHAVGDVLVQIDFQNGGTNPVLRVYKWVGSGGDTSGTLDLVAEGGSCADAGNGDLRCAIAATSPTNPAWSYDDKSVKGADNDIPAGGMVEGGINLTREGLDAGCFASFVAETRSSQEPTATLSDFTYGSFDLCEKPDIETQVLGPDGKSLGSLGTINVGESVSDFAAVGGSTGVAAGKVDFYLCGPGQAAPDCSTGGTKLGASRNLTNGQAISDLFTTDSPSDEGFYCFRAEYTPAAGSKYLAASHTNKTTECFEVVPAKIDVEKVADDASVSAGDDIGFTVTITSVGPGTAYGVKVTDTLPTDPGLDWSIDQAGTTGSWTLSGGVLSFGGANGVTMLKNATYHVHITSPTTAATCGKVDNTADATSTNDGSDDASASVDVQCPALTIEKTADAPSVSAGDPIGFTITVSNAGPGVARSVTLNDPLPTGVAWTENSTACQIDGGVLGCSFGDMEAGDSASVRLTATTSRDACAVYDNTATASATNHADVSDDAVITCNPASIDVEKVADDASVSAGDDIGFTITVTSKGPGVAKGVVLSDTYPTDAGTDWTIDGGTGAAMCTEALDGLSFSCALGDMAMNDTYTVHLSSPTTRDTVAASPVVNSATVTTTNDGSDTDTDQVVVLGPDIHVEKDGNGPLDAGDDAVFTITVRNDGDGRADNVGLTDDLPDGIDWSTDTRGCSIVPDVGTVDQVLTCDNLGSIAVDKSLAVTVTGKTVATSCPGIENTASATATNEPALDANDNSGSGSIVVNCGDITLTKAADQSPVLAGQPIGFTIEVTNTGEGTAKDVTVTDTLPDAPGLSWSVSPAVEGCSIAAGTLTCDLGDLAPEDSVSIHLVSPTTTATCGTVDNAASVTTSNDGSDEDSDKVEVQCASIDLVKRAASAPDGTVLVTMPGTVVFSYLVTNTGTATLGTFNLVDDMATPEDESDDVAIDCPEETLGPDESMTCLASIPVGFGLRTNWAVVTAHPVIEPEAEVSATDDAVVRVPQLVIDKSVSDAALLEGDITTFTLAWTLTDGPVTDGIITDVLPEGLVYLDETATDSDEFEFVDYDEATRTLTWEATTVTKNGSVTYQVAAEDGSADLVQPLENVATIDSDETTPDDDTEKVVVGKVEEETGTPKITPPSTSTIDQAPESGAGNGLTLLLVALGGLTLLAGLLVPMPARARNRRSPRNRRG